MSRVRNLEAQRLRRAAPQSALCCRRVCAQNTSEERQRRGSCLRELSHGSFLLTAPRAWRRVFRYDEDPCLRMHQIRERRER